MINKVYVKVKDFIIENLKALILFLMLFVMTTIEFPYYVNTPGGVVSVKDRIEINSQKIDNDYFNLSYVLELKGTLPNLILAKLKNDWDIIKKEDVIPSNENEEDVYFREHLMLDEANQNAIIVAYNLAKKPLSIENLKLYITYVDEEANSDLKVGDQIISINGIIVKNRDELLDIINSSTSEKLILNVKNNNTEFTRYAYTRKIDNVKKIGILINEKKDLKINDNIEFKFGKSESGPSGGLMMTLAIYNNITNSNITNNEKIAGTGTIDENGYVGSIGGVEYKIKGAVKAKIKTFLVPSGENYEEAIKTKEKYNYKINIVPIKHIDDAIKYFKNR